MIRDREVARLCCERTGRGSVALVTGTHCVCFPAILKFLSENSPMMLARAGAGRSAPGSAVDTLVAQKMHLFYGLRPDQTSMLFGTHRPLLGGLP